MFTGIVEEVGRVAAAQPGRLSISARRVVDGMTLGDSVSVNGVCLTATRFDSGSFTVDVMPETMSRSNLGSLVPGDRVNLERALALGGRMGGHLVQGHIDATGILVSVQPDGKALIMRFEAPAGLMRYVVEKGFIAVDGVSLTVTARNAEAFSVSVVGFTRENTILAERRSGARVNLEADIIAKYVEQFVQGRQGAITEGFLGEHGFLNPSGPLSGRRG